MPQLALYMHNHECGNVSGYVLGIAITALGNLLGRNERNLRVGYPLLMVTDECLACRCHTRAPKESLGPQQQGSAIPGKVRYGSVLVTHSRRDFLLNPHRIENLGRDILSEVSHVPLRAQRN